jgi:hypothetical protein
MSEFCDMTSINEETMDYLFKEITGKNGGVRQWQTEEQFAQTLRACIAGIIKLEKIQNAD